MMINEFVSGSVSIDMDAALNEYNSFMESCDNEIDTMFTEFNMMHEKVMLESEIMDSVPEDMMMVYEAEKSNIFTKIGEKIIDIFKKIIELIDKGIDKLKDLSFKHKSELQKAEIIAKKYPNFKNQILKSAEAGDLDLKDINSLKDLEKVYDEIVKLSKQKDADPKSLKAKWDNAKEKFKKDIESKAKTADSVNKFLTAGVAIAFFIPNLIKTKKAFDDMRKSTKDEEAELLNTLKSRKKVDGNLVIDDTVGILELRLQMLREKHGATSKIIGSTTSKLSNIMTELARAADRVVDNGGSRAEEYIDNMTDRYAKNEQKKAKNQNNTNKS